LVAVSIGLSLEVFWLFTGFLNLPDRFSDTFGQGLTAGALDTIHLKLYFPAFSDAEFDFWVIHNTCLLVYNCTGLLVKQIAAVAGYLPGIQQAL
jgi:hypothetical protein